MSNVAKLIIIAAMAAIASAACSSDNSRHEAAAAMVAQARALSESHNYDSALVVLDTLDVRYRDCLSERREGTMVRLQTLASLTRDSIAAAEMQMRTVTAEIDTLTPRFKKIYIEGTEGYYVDKDVYTGTEMNTTGIQARVDDTGYCFVVANVARRIGLNSIIYGDIATAPLQSIDIEGSEILSITQEPATPLLDALSVGNTDSPVKVTLSGTKGKAEVSLSAKQHVAIVNTWRYARALQLQRSLSIRLEKLERQLARLSDQIAGQIPAE